MARRAIPSIPLVDDIPTRMYMIAVKENIEVLNGVRGGRIDKLPASATMDEVIAKINEIIGRLQD